MFCKSHILTENQNLKLVLLCCVREAVLTSDVCGCESECEEQTEQWVRGEHVRSEPGHEECEDCRAFPNRITTIQLCV